MNNTEYIKLVYSLEKYIEMKNMLRDFSFRYTLDLAYND